MKWIKLEGYDPQYEISEDGKIRSNGVLMTKKMARAGYVRAELRLRKKKVSRYMHRLVYEAFIGKIPDGMMINHIDANRENNHFTNLEVVTAKGNTAHAIKIGRIKQRGADSVHAKLSLRDIIIIRKAKNRVHQKLLAQSFGVSQGHISAIQLEKKWGHLK